MLKQRVITAAILIPLMLGVIFYLPVTAFCFFTALVTLMAAWEWTSLMGLKRNMMRATFMCVLIAGFLMSLFIPIPLILLVAAIWWIVALLMVLIYPNLTGWWRNSVVARGVMGVLTLIPCWVAINYIRNLGNGSYTLLYLFILIWGADTVAYFVGRKWGTIKLAAKVSPGKSVQGFIGALVFAGVAAAGAIYLTEAPNALWPWLISLSFITIITSVVGDLFESMLKRNADVKDSGALLPGHGGLLDRIDSLTAAAPIYALMVFMMMVLAY